MKIPQDLARRVAEAVEQYFEQPQLTSDQAKVHGAIAMELHSYLKPVPEPLAEIQNESDLDIGEWLVELPFVLARHGFVEEAVTVGIRYGELIDSENFLADRAIILAEAGRREEALAQLTENFLLFPEDPWVIIKGGDVHEELGQPEQAERLYRQAMKLARDDDYARAGAVERLLILLDEAERPDERAALIEEETQRREWNRQRSKARAFDNAQLTKTLSNSLGDIEDNALSGEDDFPDPSIRRLPKIGRNDPCPCGSGKKYKKCCAVTEPK